MKKKFYKENPTKNKIRENVDFLAFSSMSDKDIGEQWNIFFGKKEWQANNEKELIELTKKIIKQNKNARQISSCSNKIECIYELRMRGYRIKSHIFPTSI